MSIIVNGITIPENIDSVYANNINLDMIVANGVVVWQKQKTYFAYQNGVANVNMGITNPTTYLSNAIDGNIRTIDITTYGGAIGIMALVGCEKGGRGPHFGAQTPNIPTNGLANVSITMRSDFIYDHGGVGTAYAEVYGINSSGDSTLLSSKIANVENTDVNVSNYKYIKVLMRWECGGGSNGLDKHLFIGVKDMKFY